MTKPKKGATKRVNPVRCQGCRFLNPYSNAAHSDGVGTNIHSSCWPGRSAPDRPIGARWVVVAERSSPTASSWRKDDQPHDLDDIGVAARLLLIR